MHHLGVSGRVALGAKAQLLGIIDIDSVPRCPISSSQRGYELQKEETQ
jgi:hypothetical protein